VIEADGGRWHGTGYRRRKDAEKQSIVERAGCRVLRLPEEELEPANEARTVALIRKEYARADPYR
jgi:very-short-patch-repair endonuclease